jgi:hypothetical protein
MRKDAPTVKEGLFFARTLQCVFQIPKSVTTLWIDQTKLMKSVAVIKVPLFFRKLKIEMGVDAFF